jgi:hypothetical protein
MRPPLLAMSAKLTLLAAMSTTTSPGPARGRVAPRRQAHQARRSLTPLSRARGLLLLICHPARGLFRAGVFLAACGSAPG